MQARIYSPSKTAMQSGQGKSGQKSDTWVLEYEPASPRKVESLMGYTSSRDMNSQIKLKFSSLESATHYCEKNGIAFQVQHPQKPKRRQIAYADNFSYNRIMPWTH